MNTGKKYRQAAGAVFAMLFLLASCSDLSVGKPESGPVPEAGLLRISLGSDSSRSIKPNFLLSAGDQISFNLLSEGSFVSGQEFVYSPYVMFYDLQVPSPGIYTLVTEARNLSDVPIGWAEQEVVTNGVVFSHLVNLAPFRTAGGTGSFQLSVAVDNLPVVPEQLVYSLAKLPDESPIGVSPNVYTTGNPNQYIIEINQTLASGDYRFRISYEYAGVPYYFGVDPIIKIYDGLVSSAIIQHTALVPTTLPVMVFDGSAQSEMYAGKRIFVSVSDGEGVNVLAAGVGTMDATGLAEIVPLSVLDYDYYTLTAGTEYLVSAFIDMDGLYNHIIGIEALMATEGIMPHYGDSSYLGTVTALPSREAIPLFSEEFEPYNSFVYFVATTSVGTGDGKTAESAANLSDVQDSLSTNRQTDPYAEHILVITGGTLELTAPLALDNSVYLVRSLSQSGSTISVTGTFEDSPFIFTGANVAFMNIEIAGTYATGLQNAAMNLNNSSVSLFDSAIYDFATSSPAGGAIFATGTSSVYLENTAITDCSAVNGGAIYAENGASILWSSGSITGNTATTAGGGVYLNGGTIADATTYIPFESHPDITGNYAAGLESNIVYVPVQTEPVSVSISFTEIGDPILSDSSINMTPGGSAELSVTEAATYVSFQWYLNGIAIDGAIGSTFTFTPGSYAYDWLNYGQNWIDVIVTDSSGNIYSAQVIVQIMEI